MFFCDFLSYHLFPAVYIKYMRLRGRGKLAEKSFKSFELYRQFHYLRYSKLNELFLQNDSIKLRIFFSFIPQSRKDECIMEHYGALSLK